MSAGTPAPSRAPSNVAVVALVALLCVVWGSTWIVIAGGLRDLPPFTSAAATTKRAAVVMSAIAPALAKKEGGTRPPFSLSLTVGLLNFAASYGIVYWSETRIPSGLTSVLWSVYPLMMSVSGWLFLKAERLRALQMVGMVLGFAGVVLLFATDLSDVSAEAVLAGFVLLGSPLVACVGTTIAKKQGGNVSSALMNRNAMWIGAIALVVVALITERDETPRWSAAAIGTVAYLAIAGTVLTFGVYFWLLRTVAAYRLAMISYVTPAIALTLGTLVGKEPLTVWTIAGSLTILAGVALVVMKPRAFSR